MKYLVLIYDDEQLLDALPEGEAEQMMKECLACSDELRQTGHLLDSKVLGPSATATSLRLRNGRLTTTDGPFADTREHLGGLNLIEARDLNEAIRVASRFPWARTGCLEIRPLQDLPASMIRSEP